jgi:alpha-glucoside transport system substrate-binding protein
MRRAKLLIPLAVVIVVAAACSTNSSTSSGSGAAGGPTEENTGKVNILSAVDPKEGKTIQSQVLDPDINDVQSDYTVELEADGNFEQDVKIRAQAGTLDLAMLPQPGSLPDLVATGNAVSMEDMGFDIAALEQTFGKPFMDLGVVDGKHYEIPTNINLKSMIWYPKDDFDKAGYTIPQTWDDLMALSDQIVADGSTPWCVGFQSEGSSGWPATDWMEDIMLRTAGPETYDKWVKHEIPFNDPAVLTAAQDFGDVMFHPNYVLGGAANTASLAFGDSPLPMFDNPPKCWLQRQASFIPAFFPEDAQAGVDYDWFPFPSMDTEGGPLFGGEVMMAFRNAPEVKSALEAFSGTEVQCGMGGYVGSSRISPNTTVSDDCYADQILKDSADVLREGLSSGSARFDASDLMPAAVGTGSFWTGMIKYMQQGPDSIQGILDDIEASWPSS